MGSFGLERGFAVAVGAVLVVLGLAGSLGNPIVGRPETTDLIVTGVGHDLMHIVSGALFLHVGLALNGRNRANGLIVLGVVFLVTGILSFLTSDLLGLYGAPASGLDQVAHVVLGIAAIGVGWRARGVPLREVGRGASRPIRS
jgi:hypothetical protein